MSARRRTRKLSTSDEDSDSAPSQERSQPKSSSSQSQSQSQNHRGSRNDIKDETMSELQSQYMFDEETIDAAKRSRNLRQQLYGGLIQNVQGFQDRDGVGGFDLRTALTESALKGQQLGEIRTVHTSDLYNALKHANLCTKMLRFHSERVGDTKTFKADHYIAALKSLGDQLHSRLAKVFAESAAIGCTLYNLTGTFDREPTAPKEEAKKSRTGARRKRNFDDSPDKATQYEEGGGGAGSERRGTRGGGGDGKDGPPSSAAEQLSNKVFRALKLKSRGRPKPFNLYEFALSKESLGDTIQNLFYTGFLIRDAWASLSSSAGATAAPQSQSQGEGSGRGDLILKPDKPPKKGAGAEAGGAGAGQQGALRNQHILSFSPKLYRELLAAAKGDTEISELDENDNQDVKVEESRSKTKHSSKTPKK